jgi:hypothetical protein
MEDVSQNNVVNLDTHKKIVNNCMESHSQTMLNLRRITIVRWKKIIILMILAVRTDFKIMLLP